MKLNVQIFFLRTEDECTSYDIKIFIGKFDINFDVRL